PAQLDALADAADAPLGCDVDRVGLGAVKNLGHAPAEEVLLPVARQLEDAVAGCEHSRLLVADDEARVRAGVVVVEQLEEEAEAAVVARRRIGAEAFSGVDVDRPLLAIGADVGGHASMVATLLRSTSSNGRRRAGRALWRRSAPTTRRNRIASGSPGNGVGSSGRRGRR